MSDPLRKKLLRTLHARARELGIDDDLRRSIQLGVTGKESAADMTVAELRHVLDSFSRKRAPRGDELPRHAMTKKLRALWISGWHLGVVRDRTDEALCAYVAQALGLDAARWAKDRMPAAVEEIKRLLAREAGVDWSPVEIRCDGRVETRDAPRVRVLEAQWRRLQELGEVRIAGALDHYVSRIVGIGVRPLDILEDEQADEAIRVLGARIRKAQRRAAG